MRQCGIESKEIICRQTYRLQFIKIFFITVRQYLMTLFLIAVRQEVKRINNSVVVHELELATTAKTKHTNFYLRSDNNM